jgi:membrane protein implicated in regulation of membrane protease activity
MSMGIIGRITLSLWIVIVGVIAMYVFFIAVASIPPAQVAGVTAVVAALAVIFLIRSMRISSELASRGGDPALRRARNRARERRGF